MGPAYVRKGEARVAARVDVHGSMSEVMDHGRVVITQDTIEQQNL